MRHPATNPVFTYTSACCSVRAEKPPCQRDPEDKKANDFSQSPLGTWNCTRCRKACTVSRERVRK